MNTTILALDLGTRTGWALQHLDGTITSGTEHFKPQRFEGGGMRFLRFKRWLAELLSVSGHINAVFFEEVRRHAGVDAAHAYGGFMARQKNAAGKRIFLSLDWPNKAHWWLPLRDHPRDGFLTFMDVGTNANMTVLGNGDKTTTTEGGKTRNQFLSRTAMPSRVQGTSACFCTLSKRKLSLARASMSASGRA